MFDNNEIDNLKKKVAQLESENQLLKGLLDKAGIFYEPILSEKSEKAGITEFDQGVHICHVEITDKLANRFFAMFWGRTDVYSKRVINKKTGAVGYYPQCDNFWTYGCPKKYGKKVRCQDCDNRKWSALGKTQILQHLKGNSKDESDVIGVYPLLQDDTCRFIVFDFDDHENVESASDDMNGTWKEEVDTLREICKQNGIDALTERSRSGRGAHVWIFFQKPIPATLARKFGYALLKKGEQSVSIKSFKYYDRLLPMQDHISQGSLGNLIALPLQGQALKRGNSAFVDEKWNVYPEQWKKLFGTEKLSEEFVENCVREWSEENPFNIDEQETEKPWDKSKQFYKEDVDGIVKIVLADGIYIEILNLKPRIQNMIRKMAAFGNPEFYRNQAIGLSNYANSRIIYLGRDEGNYIRIPRGLLDKLESMCAAANIQYDISDKRCTGKIIDVEFTGSLKEQQIPAVKKLLEVECGILSAATAFGKTVVCTRLIAERKVSTLILLQSSALIPQWQKALESFLTMHEELPEYKTPTGRTKKRKSVIGKIQGSYDSSTGIIDIAMVASLCKNGEYHYRLGEYGLIIVDECHHAASDTMVGVLEQVRAKYVYGVTATPMRGDGLERINDMLLGPIRYRYTAKDRAKEQGIAYLVYPRFTRAVAPRFQKDRLHPNEAYEIIRNNEVRDEQILGDIRKCVETGRTPVVLSRYKDHSQRLYDKMQTYADKVFLLTGTNSKKKHQEILRQMSLVPPEKTMILVATGSLIGEGFDYPRLDTLIMATPVAGRGVVEQYAGRLNRDYEGKESVIIYDYVDSHIPMFDNMYGKRLKAYKQIGYKICSGLQNTKQAVRAIYDIDNYADVYKKDLLKANKEIIISSPVISTGKVYEMITFLKEKQEIGIKVRVVTWTPDGYGFGDGAKWMELQDKMRQAGFEMDLTEDYCEHFVIIDSEIVWYGSMNFLAKEDAEDNLMRVCSQEIAAELLELTYGKDKACEVMKV